MTIDTSTDALLSKQSVWCSGILTRDQRDVCQLLLVQVTLHNPEATFCVFWRDGHARHYAGNAMLAGVFNQTQRKFLLLLLLLLLTFICGSRGRASRYSWHVCPQLSFITAIMMIGDWVANEDTAWDTVPQNASKCVSM